MCRLSTNFAAANQSPAGTQPVTNAIKTINNRKCDDDLQKEKTFHLLEIKQTYSKHHCQYDFFLQSHWLNYNSLFSNTCHVNNLNSFELINNRNITSNLYFICNNWRNILFPMVVISRWVTSKFPVKIQFNLLFFYIDKTNFHQKKHPIILLD